MDTYQMVTDKIVEMLEQGFVPWTKPWTAAYSCAWSGATGKPYSLLNQMMLLSTDKSKSFAQRCEEARGEWLTYNQAQERGGSVRKGEHGRRVVFFKPLQVKDENGEESARTIPLLVSYVVFHIRQCDGVEQKFHREKAEESPFSPLEQGEKTAEDYRTRSGVLLVHTKGDQACYNPRSDTVTMPMPEQFSSPAEYYSTLFHEYTHSTGHEKRLNRRLSGFLGNQESYSVEELTAEIGSASILATLGIDTDGSLRNSAAYIQSWLKALRDDKRMIVTAASRAEKAVRLILGIDSAEEQA